MAITSSKYLYRILGIKHVVDLLESNELHFVSPSLWDDPYEGGLIHKRSHAIFAQCWCKKAASDAMWRIYSGDRTGVRLRTTRAKLEVALLTYKRRSSIDFFIGDVEYLSAREVTSRISDIAKDLKREYKSRRAADALLVKRDAFDHEAEVRVILHDQELIGQPKPKPFFRVPISADTLIDNVSFDPRADDAFVKMFTYYLKNSLKFEGTVKKSGLYRVREPVVVD